MKKGVNKERMLTGSLLKGTAVGIKLKGSDEFIVSCVVNLQSGENHEKWIEIKPYTLYGKPINETIISLSNIEKIVSYSVRFDDPLYVRLCEIKGRILGIQ